MHDSSITFRNSAQYNIRVVASGANNTIALPSVRNETIEAEDVVVGLAVGDGSGVEEEEKEEEMHGRLPCPR